MAGYTVRRTMWRWAPGAFVLAFALALALFGGTGYAAPENVHASVYQWASQHPEQNVPIILRTSGEQATTGGTVTAFGGEVKQDLDFISAIQANVPASSLRALSRADGVEYISLDAPVISADEGSDNRGSGSNDTAPTATPAPADTAPTDTPAPADTAPTATPAPADTAPTATPAPADTAPTPAPTATPGSPAATPAPTAVPASATAVHAKSIGAENAWAVGFTGANVGIAVIDTGISPSTNADFGGRVIASVETSSVSTVTTDGYGHGTHVAGYAAGNGANSGGQYKGIAPQANLINVKIADDQGGASLGDLLAGLSWVNANAATYNIKVINLSLHSSVAESYKTSPLDAAVEILWSHGILVVVASGNTGGGVGAVSFPPANDPFVLTIGSLDDRNTPDWTDDIVSSFTSRGVTQDGFVKPELYTPGSNIFSTTDPASVLYQHYAGTPNVQPGPYLMLSGTSMAAAAASGAAALAFHAHPTWSPGQVKCTMTTRVRLVADGTSTVKVPRMGLVTTANSPSCNSNNGLVRSRALGPLLKVAVVASIVSQSNPQSAAEAINFKPMSAIGGSNVTLQSIKWDSIKWDSIKWDVIKWDSVKWDVIKWDSIKWDVIKWNQVDSAGVNFDVIKWDSIKWDAVNFDAIKWDSIKWDVVKWDQIDSGD